MLILISKGTEVSRVFQNEKYHLLTHMINRKVERLASKKMVKQQKKTSVAVQTFMFKMPKQKYKHAIKPKHFGFSVFFFTSLFLYKIT